MSIRLIGLEVKNLGERSLTDVVILGENKNGDAIAIGSGLAEEGFKVSPIRGAANPAEGAVVNSLWYDPKTSEIMYHIQKR
tara:strand:- start:6981 stop:7223 length:243 start_codon:yes stop_codon:yes gene_type:complete